MKTDAPDLGAFITVFRALNTFNPSRARSSRFNHDDATPTSSLLSPSEDDSEVPGGSTVWSQRPIASYLSSESPESPPSSSSPEPTELDSTEDPSLGSRGSGGAEERDREEDTVDSSNQPSLGLFGALDFLAAERAKFAAQRDAAGHRGNSSTTSDGTWQHALSPRRKRRRKRNRSAGISKNRTRHPDESPPAAGDAEETAEGATVSYDDADDSSYSSDGPSRQQYYKSTPPTPPPELKRQAQKASGSSVQPRIHHSKSTPSLRLPSSMPIDARVLQLRNLAHKLRMLFPQDAASLSAILSNDHPSPTEVVDPRGPEPRSKDTLIHIFIDQYVARAFFRSYLILSSQLEYLVRLFDISETTLSPHGPQAEVHVSCSTCTHTGTRSSRNPSRPRDFFTSLPACRLCRAVGIRGQCSAPRPRHGRWSRPPARGYKQRRPKPITPSIFSYPFTWIYP